VTDSPRSDNPLVELAQAAIYVPDLARGVIGEIEITEEGWGEGDVPRVLEEIHRGQRTLVEAGWRRSKHHERHAPYTHNVEVAVYRKQLEGEKVPHWIVVLVTTRFGLHSVWKGLGPRKKGPWEV